MDRKLIIVARYCIQFLALLYKLLCGVPSQFYDVFMTYFELKFIFLHGVPDFSKTYIFFT